MPAGERGLCWSAWSPLSAEFVGASLRRFSNVLGSILRMELTENLELLDKASSTLIKSPDKAKEVLEEHRNNVLTAS